MTTERRRESTKPASHRSRVGTCSEAAAPKNMKRISGWGGRSGFLIRRGRLPAEMWLPLSPGLSSHLLSSVRADTSGHFCERRARLLPQRRRRGRLPRGAAGAPGPAARTSISQGEKNNERKMERGLPKLRFQGDERKQRRDAVFRSAERRQVRPQNRQQ